MSDPRPEQAPASGRTRAGVRRSRWPGWIWAVPVAAAAVVVWLAIRYWVEAGPDVQVTFSKGADIQTEDTKVRYRGIDVGKVTGVRLSHDLNRVVVTLSMNANMEPVLRQGTRFWIAGGSPTLTDLNSLKAIITGPYIAIDPGPGRPSRHFRGLDKPPAVMNGAAGLRLTLHAATLGNLQAGSDISYLGLTVGTIEKVALAPGGKGFDLAAFIDAPYDRLVHRGTRFWDQGIQIATAGSGVTAKLPPLDALVAGGIAFTTPDPAEAGPPAATGAAFTLYPGKEQAEAAPYGRGVPFLVRFDGSVGDLSQGAEVELKGFRIGEVARVALAFDARTGTLDTPVTIVIDPARLPIAGITPPGNGDWGPAVVQAIAKLVGRGYRARLDRSTPVVGGRIVVLDRDPTAASGQLIAGGPHPEIPTESGGGIGQITSQASAVMAKIDRIPIEQIGQDVARTTARLAALAGSPAVVESLHHVDDAIANLDRTIRRAGPQVGPMVASLRQTARATDAAVASANAVLGGIGAQQNQNLPDTLHELADAARSIRALADYLDRHPEALIHGRTGGGP